MKKFIAMIVMVCLICVQAATPCLAFEELSKGSKGDAVVELQNRLNELGYSVGKPDGDFGGKTEKAVKKYQVDYDLEVTGIVDKSTYDTLFGEGDTIDSDTTLIPDNDDTETSPSKASSSVINKDEIVDIWLSYSRVYILMSNGDILKVKPVTKNNPELQVETIDSDVKAVMHNSKQYFYTKDNIQWVKEYNDSIDKYNLDEEWQNITVASGNSNHAVGLKDDGTWVAAGAYADGQCDVDEWTDIISIGTGYNHTVGLKSDGTVVATGKKDEKQCDVSDWKDIIQISVDGDTTLGLKSDGTVVATGDNSEGQCDVSEWTNIRYICCGGSASFGLTNDGKLLTTKDSYFKGDKNSRLIPRKFQCENAVRIEAYCNFATINGMPIDGLYDGTLLVIKKDNSIELFGENPDGECDQAMSLINDSTEANDSNKQPDNTASNISTEFSEKQCIDIALEYMKTHISQYLKNPSSLQINGTNCIKGEGTTYWVTIDYSAMNSFGGYERNQYYCQVDYTTGEVIDGGII